MQNKIYPVLNAKFWWAYFTTMRPYLLFVSGAAGLVGLAFIENPSTFRLLLAFIPLLLSYGFGQALTDCFQTDTDSISSPYRPLVKGTISKKQVLIISLIGLIIGVLILGYLNPKILILGLLAIIGLLTYTYLKRTWWGGPPWNSWIVALLPIMGRLVDREYYFKCLVNLHDSYSLAFIFSIIAIFFGYANFVVMGYFKDITADTKTSYRTFPVVFGWTANTIYSDILALLTALLSGYAIFFLIKTNLYGSIVFTIALIINIYAQLKIHLTKDENKSHGPIENIVRAFILYCLALTLTLKSNWLIFIILFYILFEINLKFRPEKKQV
jgi:4-hydroxybenzoate polyprenyltransferase